MFKYHGCIGRHGSHGWLVTFEDGTADAAYDLAVALSLCDNRIRRSSR